MIKNIIAPVQAWLLARGQCVGCGTPLSRGKTTKTSHNLSKVNCKCGRIFIFDSQTKKYRRALFEEV